jgi:thiol-disulfide isomerase/thioredoxin
MEIVIRHGTIGAPMLTRSLLVRAPVLLSLVAVTALAAGCATAGGTAGGDAPARGVGDPVPDLTLQEFFGKKDIRLASLRGKVVLLDIWASWCDPCKEEMPLLDAMAARLRGKGVEIIAVSVDEERGSAEQFLRSRRHWALTVAHDPRGAVPERLQPPKMPTSYLIDGKGILRQVNAGFERGDVDRLEAQLLELAGRR